VQFIVRKFCRDQRFCHSAIDSRRPCITTGDGRRRYKAGAATETDVLSGNSASLLGVCVCVCGLLGLADWVASRSETLGHGVASWSVVRRWRPAAGAFVRRVSTRRLGAVTNWPLRKTPWHQACRQPQQGLVKHSRGTPLGRIFKKFLPFKIEHCGAVYIFERRPARPKRRGARGNFPPTRFRRACMASTWSLAQDNPPPTGSTFFCVSATENQPQL